MSKKSLMFKLPEVAHLIERVPIARVVIKPNAIHLRYLQHAREAGIPLRKQCEDFNIPWHARKVSEGLSCKKVLKTSRLLAPSVFAQTLPDTKEKADKWADKICLARDRKLPAHAFHWVAHHGAEIDSLWPLVRYLKSLGSIPAGRSYDDVKRKALEFEEAHPMQPFHGDMLELMDVRHHWITVANHFRRGGAIDAGGIRGLRGGAYMVDDVEDRTPIEHGCPVELTSRESTIRLLERPEDFDNLGHVLNNCIASSGAGAAQGIVLAGEKVNYFGRVKRGYCRIASVQRHGNTIAAVEYAPDWSVKDVRGPGNKKTFDPAVMSIVDEFATMAKAELEKPND